MTLKLLFDNSPSLEEQATVAVKRMALEAAKHRDLPNGELALRRSICHGPCNRTIVWVGRGEEPLCDDCKIIVAAEEAEARELGEYGVRPRPRTAQVTVLRKLWNGYLRVFPYVYTLIAIAQLATRSKLPLIPGGWWPGWIGFVLLGLWLIYYDKQQRRRRKL